MDQRSKIFKEIMAFCNRWQLDTLQMVNSFFANLIAEHFHDTPYRLFRQLNFCLICQSKRDPGVGFAPSTYCTVYYLHQIKKLTFSQVFMLCSNPTVRFATTYVCIDADCAVLGQFGSGFFDISHVWKDQTLVIDMDSRSVGQRQAANFYSTLFSGKLAVTHAKELVLVDRNFGEADVPHFYPFSFSNLNDCNTLIICAGLSVNLVDNIVDYLHEGQGHKKKLCYSFMHTTSTQAYNVVSEFSKLTKRLKRRFNADTQPCPFVLWCLNVFCKAGETKPLECNATTKEVLQFENKSFSKMRNKTRLEESAFRDGSSDVRIKRFVAQPSTT